MTATLATRAATKYAGAMEHDPDDYGAIAALARALDLMEPDYALALVEEHPVACRAAAEYAEARSDDRRKLWPAPWQLTALGD